MERRTKIAVIKRARGRERRHWKGIIYNGRNSGEEKRTNS